MATADLLFDVSTLHYPEYQGGLIQLAEVSMISSFVRSFKQLNDNIKLTRDQLQDCWFHALHREYTKALGNKAHMTQDQIRHVEELLSQGIEHANTFALFSRAEWDAADYEPPQINEDLQQESNHVEAEIPRGWQSYDPLVLLQSIPEIRVHAERIYQNGLQKLLLRAKLRNRRPNIEQYKLNCVSQAQNELDYLLQANYQPQEGPGADNFTLATGKAREPQPASQNWKKDTKWKGVRDRLAAERKQIASGLGIGLPAEQGLKNLFCDPADQVLTSMKRERKQRKKVARRKNEVEKRLKAESDENMNTALILSNREPFSNISMDDSGRPGLSASQQRAREKIKRFYGSKKGNEVTLASAGTSPNTSRKAGMDVEDPSVTSPSNFTSQAEELEAVTIKAEAQDEPQAYDGDEMDVEMSGRIAKLEM